MASEWIISTKLVSDGCYFMSSVRMNDEPLSDKLIVCAWSIITWLFCLYRLVQFKRPLTPCDSLWTSWTRPAAMIHPGLVHIYQISSFVNQTTIADQVWLSQTRDNIPDLGYQLISYLLGWMFRRRWSTYDTAIRGNLRWKKTVRLAQLG